MFYYTPLFRWSTLDHVGHAWMVVHFLITGYLFVQSLIGIDPVPYRLPYPFRLVLLLGTMAFHAFFGLALMTGTGLLLADWYGAMGALGPDALVDQQVGGGIAWCVGEIPTVALAITVAVQWSAQRREGVEAPRPRTPTAPATPSSRPTTRGSPPSPSRTRIAADAGLRMPRHPVPASLQLDRDAAVGPDGRGEGDLERPVLLERGEVAVEERLHLDRDVRHALGGRHLERRLARREGDGGIGHHRPDRRAHDPVVDLDAEGASGRLQHLLGRALAR